MPLLRSSLFVLAAAAVLFAGDVVQAQNRNTTTRRTTQGTSGGMGTSPTQSSITSAQNQARSIANRQHQIWLAHRLKKNAEAKAAEAKAAETKAAAKAAAAETSTNSKPTTTTIKSAK